MRFVGAALFKWMKIKADAAAGSWSVFEVDAASASVVVCSYLDVLSSISDSGSRSDNLTDGSRITASCGFSGINCAIDDFGGGVNRVRYRVNDSRHGVYRVFDCVHEGGYGHVRNPLHFTD